MVREAGCWKRVGVKNVIFTAQSVFLSTAVPSSHGRRRSPVITLDKKQTLGKWTFLLPRQHFSDAVVSETWLVAHLEAKFPGSVRPS